MRSQSKAFTLMEILLVSILISVVSVAIFRCFASGLKLWAKAKGLTNEAEAAIFLDKMAEDLRSTVILSQFGFKGSSSQLSFPTVILTKADVKSSRSTEDLINQIGAVQYRYDYQERKILRKQANYAQALKKKWQDEELTVASGVDQLNFHYQVASLKGFQLKSEIQGGIPSGIVVEVVFSDAKGQHQLKRYLPLLVGY